MEPFAYGAYRRTFQVNGQRAECSEPENERLENDR